MNITKYILTIYAAVFCLILAFASFGQTVNETRVLPVIPIEREIRGGETHSYQINLKTGEFLRVTVEQNGVDVVLRLVAPDGKLLAERDRPNGTNGEESLSYEVGAAGAYRMEIAALEKDAAVGKYQIRHESPRIPTANDKKRIAAENFFQEAQKLRETQTAEAWTTAAAKYETAAASWRELGDDYAAGLTQTSLTYLYKGLGQSEKAMAAGNIALAFYRTRKDRAGESDILQAVGEATVLTGKFAAGRGQLSQAAKIKLELGDKAAAYKIADKLFEYGREVSKNYAYQEAIEFFKSALPLYQATGSQKDEAWIYVWLGNSYNNLSDKQQALKFYNESLPLFRVLGDKSGEAVMLSNIGLVYSTLGDKQQALKFYNEALPLSRIVGDKLQEATTLTNIGAVYDDLGDKQQALKFYNVALPLRRVVGDKFGEAMTLNNIGRVYDALGDKQQALKFYKEALPLSRVVGNKNGEATTLSNIGAVYSDLGDKQQALKFYNESLSLSRIVGDKSGEATTLNNIGKIYSDLGENQKALKFYNEALPLSRIVGDKSQEATTLNNIGGIYDALGDKQQALKFYNEALPLFRVVGNKSGEGTTLTNIGVVYSTLGENQKALKFYNEALPLSRIVGDKFGEATTLNNIGRVYDALGDKQQALKFYNEALPLFRVVENKSGEATTLSNIGTIYFTLGDKQQALKFYNESLSLSRIVGDKSGEAVTLNNISGIYFDLGENQKALKFLNEALPLSRIVGDKSQEAAMLNNIGKVYDNLGDKQQALKFYNDALPLRRAVGDKSGEAVTLDNVMFAWNALGNRRLAAFYGKQSVNKYQELRLAIQELDKEIQKTYLKTFEDTYRRLADILIADGRLFEAQQVLAMLKEDEYFGYVRRDADEIKKLSARADLRLDEQAALVKYEQLAGKITEYGTQVSKLEELKNAQGSDFRQQTEYEALNAKLTAANTAFRLFLDKELVAEFSKRTKIDDKIEINKDRALQTKLQQWSKGTVALYTVAGDDRYRVILTTPKTQIDGKTEIKIADLNKKIFEFRAALQNPQVDPRSLGKELYDILIKPIEKDLQAAEAKTLLWSLDGTLRYIPFAALSPDGVHYLAEKYQNVVITSTTRQSLLAETDPNWRLLGAGVTKASKLTEPNGSSEISFSALPEVKNELLKIVSNEDAKPKESGLMSGIRLLDEGFDLTTLENGMTQRTGNKPKYNVIHLATHFRLGGDTAKSFLLMGNNQALTLEKVSDDTALNFGDVELVTLSACNTGFGTAIENKSINKEQERKLLEANNGAEVDSLATFIELRGAKAVLASLWSVADESTQMLMSEFYRLRKENPQMTKAEAMQQAQKSMIEGRLKSSGKQTGCRSEIVNLDGKEQIAFKCDTNAPFAHPYFWSPFVLIGNWR